jgi:hypothetical protein
MGVPMRLHHYSFKDYLAVEESNPVRHEFLDGEIYAMAGGTILHARTETIGPGAVGVIDALACSLDVNALYARAGG